jgi:tetratricopeptide (TPR) repeat protein
MDSIYDLRVEDHVAPVPELKRLLKLNKAYNHMNRGDDYMTDGMTAEAMKEYTKGMEIYPDNPEMIFWPAVTLASTGKVDESLPLFKKVFAADSNWAVLLERLPKAGQFPNDKKLIQKILAVMPKK